jgi:hypothetical protein
MLPKGCLEMYRGLRIPLTISMFVSAASQRVAEKVGFTFIKEHPYSEPDEDGIVIYYDIKHNAQIYVYKL